MGTKCLAITVAIIIGTYVVSFFSSAFQLFPGYSCQRNLNSNRVNNWEINDEWMHSSLIWSLIDPGFRNTGNEFWKIQYFSTMSLKADSGVIVLWYGAKFKKFEETVKNCEKIVQFVKKCNARKIKRCYIWYLIEKYRTGEEYFFVLYHKKPPSERKLFLQLVSHLEGKKSRVPEFDMLPFLLLSHTNNIRTKIRRNFLVGFFPWLVIFFPTHFCKSNNNPNRLSQNMNSIWVQIKMQVSDSTNFRKFQKKIWKKAHIDKLHIYR